jgi:hypothetical protein
VHHLAHLWITSDHPESSVRFAPADRPIGLNHLVAERFVKLVWRTVTANWRIDVIEMSK